MAALLTLVLLAAAIAIVGAPLLAGRDAPALAGRAEQRDELESERESKYREIRDAELDYRTGKLSREDHQAVDAALRAEALAILDALQALDAERPEVETSA